MTGTDLYEDVELFRRLLYPPRWKRVFYAAIYWLRGEA
jgi:hypothetical protein